MDFGSTIKAAREARGLTTSQVAAQTRILVQIIEDMERNVFKRIPAPIYGRGFVKLICECLDLDPVTMVPAFMAAFNGEPQIPDAPQPTGGIRYAAPEAPPPAIPPVSRPIVQETPQPFSASVPTATSEATEQPQAAAVAPTPVEPAAEQPAQVEPTAVQPTQVEEVAPAPQPPEQPPLESPPKATIDSSLRGLELFDPSAAPVEPPPVQRPAEGAGFSRLSQPSSNEGFSRFAPPSAEDDFSRFAAPAPEDDTPKMSPMERFREGFSSVSSGVLGQMKNIPPSTFRIAILVVGVLLVLALCGWGIVALFRATSSDGNTPEPQAAEETVNAEAPSEKPAEKPAGQSSEQTAPDGTATPTRPTVPLKLPGFYVD